jgi:hypothetical protein
MLLISFKPLGIERSPDLYAKFVVQDSPNYLELLKYGILPIEGELGFPFLF